MLRHNIKNRFQPGQILLKKKFLLVLKARHEIATKRTRPFHFVRTKDCVARNFMITLMMTHEEWDNDNDDDDDADDDDYGTVDFALSSSGPRQCVRANRKSYDGAGFTHSHTAAGTRNRISGEGWHGRFAKAEIEHGRLFLVRGRERITYPTLHTSCPHKSDRHSLISFPSPLINSDTHT